MSETIRVSKETKQSLVRAAAALQQERGTRVSLDQTIKHLFEQQQGEDDDKKKKKDPELLKSVIGSVPGLSVKKLRAERALDEERAGRKYHTR